jgi:hypothetical protein
MTRPPRDRQRPGVHYFRLFEGKPIADLWLFSQMATRRHDDAKLSCQKRSLLAVDSAAIRFKISCSSNVR